MTFTSSVGTIILPFQSMCIPRPRGRVDVGGLNTVSLI